jgi:galactokinase
VAPGRLTLVGDHVDYVGGRILCMAIDLALGCAVRPSSDGRWRVAGDGRTAQRAQPEMCGDVGDRVFAAALALGRLGFAIPPIEAGVAADLPVAAGLSSSAAVVTATLVALLRLCGGRLSGEGLVGAATTAEREIVGVPTGDLDQRAIVHGRAGAALLLDCADGSHATIPWPWPRIGVLVAASGERHDIAGAAYQERRQAAERACRLLGVAGCQEIGERWRELPPDLRPRARHVATETRRSDDAAAALRSGDARALGRLIDASHESLRSDCAVSTPRIDAMVEAARRVPGCHGARLVGGGFGGSVMALVDHRAARRCAAALAATSGGREGAWLVAPAAGLAVAASDVVVAAEASA